MKKLIESKWDEILSLLETEYDISKIMINTWIKTLNIFEVKDNTVYFFVDEKLGENALKFIRKKEYDLFLLSSIRETLNNIDIEIIIDEKKNYVKGEEKVKEVVLSDSYQDAINRSNLNPKFTFDTFIVGDSNRHAHATCLAVADMPAQDNFNPLFLYGNSGLGKTHLMQSIAHYILQNDENANVLYVSSEKFTNEIINSIQNHTTNDFREKYRNVDVLLIDDVQFIEKKESTQMEFFNTFNTLYDNKKQIILSSDRPPKDIKNLDARIISRFASGLPIDIHEPDYETRMAILKNKAKRENLKDIPEDVYIYIAENVTNNIRELEGALNKISMYCKLMNEKVTLDIAKDSLKDLINKDANIKITPERVTSVVCEHMGISENDIMSKKRTQDIATARQIIMYILRKYTVLSLKSVGNAVGGKDHTTVMNGCKRVEENYSKDEAFKNTIDTIIKKLNIS